MYPLLVNVKRHPDYGEAARLDDGRFLLPVLGLPRFRIPAPRPTPRPRHHPPGDDDAVAAGGPAAAGSGCARRHHPGAPGAMTPGHRTVAGADWTVCSAPPNDQPGRRPDGVVAGPVPGRDPDLTVNAMTGLRRPDPDQNGDPAGRGSGTRPPRG